MPLSRYQKDEQNTKYVSGPWAQNMLAYGWLSHLRAAFVEGELQDGAGSRGTIVYHSQPPHYLPILCLPNPKVLIILQFLSWAMFRHAIQSFVRMCKKYILIALFNDYLLS